jgi:putative glycosyltransferase (TIGR04348 family)
MALRIQLLCPAPPDSRSGNRVTALRWAKMIRALGHHARILHDLRDPNVGDRADVLVLLHAKKCAGAARRFRSRHPHRPLVVALTGTDLYRDLDTQPSAHRSLELADRIILLQRSGLLRLAPHIRKKSQIIHQSTPPVSESISRSTRHFDVCVVGHLRGVKDPMRCAMAVRRLPDSSRIRVTHLGKALTSHFESRATKEMRTNSRYRWLGERSHVATRKQIARSHVFVLTSKMEGGANVIGEACVAGVPIIASHIDGSIGLLGEQHPGFFERGDTAELRRLLICAENDERFLQRLCASSRRAAPLFAPEREKNEWRKLIEKLPSRAT